MLETIILGIVGFVIGVGLSKTVKEIRDRRALRGKDLTIEKKLVATTIRLKAAEKQNDDMRIYLGLNPGRREALPYDDAPPAASKKGRTKKKVSDPDSLAVDLKGLGVGAGSMPMPILILMTLGTAMIAEQQKKKGQPKKYKDLKDLKARLEKKVGTLEDVSKQELIESYSKVDARAKVHPAEPFSKSDKSLMELKRRLNKKLQDKI